jgi:hypothetical protein
MEQLEQNLEIWREGFHSGLMRTDRRCPYQTGTVEAWSWRSGFIEGRAERDKTS